MAILVTDVRNVIGRLCDLIIENEVYFCELDSVAGDGDFGMSLSKGFREVKNQLDEFDTTTVDSFVRAVSMVITEYCGGASGPIWGTAFRFAANSVKDKRTIEVKDIATMLDAAVMGIQKRGGAKKGDKTLLDALIPAAAAFYQAAEDGLSVQECTKEAAAAARQGAEATKNMVASKGRATYVGERSLEHPDAGAVAIGVIFSHFAGEDWKA